MDADDRAHTRRRSDRHAGQVDAVEQLEVAVVEDPSLGPGQQGSKPPRHRTGPASEVVDDELGCGQEGHELVDELGRTGRGVGRFT